MLQKILKKIHVILHRVGLHVLASSVCPCQHAKVDERLLRAIDFDPLWNCTCGIDVAKDLAFPASKLDIN
jgi:hypothetical protein